MKGNMNIQQAQLIKSDRLSLPTGWEICNLED
jgi:hypothetical protein